MRGVTAILLGTTLVLASCDMYGVRVQDYFDETTTAPLASNGELCAAGENLLEDNLDHASVFMTGEAHGTADSIRIASMLARYFAESGRATTLLWEIGFAAGFYLDEYITGGDPSLLDGILESSEGTYLFTHEWRDFYQQIRAFNQTRIPAVRIRILGIDIEHQYTRGITLMREALPAAALNSAPEAIRPTVDELVTWSSADADRAADDELSAAISRSLQVESSTWEGYLGPSFDRFEIAALSVRSRFDSYGAGRDGFAVAREAAIEEIFRRADIWHRARIDPAAPFYYGHWGRAHIRRERADGVDWIAGRIESIPGYEASVRTAKLFYRDCRSLRRNPYRVTPLTDVPIVLGLLTRSSVGSITLYDLDEDGSPFVHRAELVDSPQAGHVTVDYFRLAILVRDGTAAVPLSGTYPR